MLKNVLVTIAFLVIALVFYLAYKVKLIKKETHGKKTSDDYNNKALVIIDVQKDLVGIDVDSKFKNVDKKIKSINEMINWAESQSYEVAYVTHEFSNTLVNKLLSQNKLIENTSGAKIDDRVNVTNENKFVKEIGDAFSNKEFENFLLKKQVNELYLTGLDGAHCVYKTAIGGKNRNFNVSVIDEATFSSKDELKLIQMYKERDIKLISKNQLIG